MKNVFTGNENDEANICHMKYFCLWFKNLFKLSIGKTLKESFSDLGIGWSRHA